MTISYILCDRCGASVPEATGALVLRYGGYPQAHLCDKCCDEVFPNNIIAKVKGDPAEQEGAPA